MSFQLEHPLVSTRFTPVKRTSGPETFFKVSVDGQFTVFFPGQLRKRALATYSHRLRVSDPNQPDEGSGPQPSHGGFETVTETIALQIQVFTPDGVEFPAAEITLSDLRKFRDLRGSPVGRWSYKITGESRHFQLNGEDKESISNPKGFLGLDLIETVHSESAPALISNAPVGPFRQQLRFDLFRLGSFVAEITQASPFDTWRGTIRLLDPNGTQVAGSTSKKLVFNVDLAALGKSRDNSGAVREWTLEISPQAGTVTGSPRISAIVIGSGRITTAALQDRILRMLGPHGSFIRLFGENKNGEALGRLEITDAVAAETIDMHGLLDKPLSWAEQDPGVDPKDIKANTVYTLARTSESLKFSLKLDVSTLKVDTIEITVGAGVKLGPAVPAVRLNVKVSGKAKIKLGPATIADAGVRDGKLDMEVGIKLSPDGTPQLVTSVPDKPFDLDLSWGVVLAAGAIAGPLIAFGLEATTEYLEDVLNRQIASGAREIFADPTLAPRILMTIFGAHLSYRPPRMEGNDIVFDHIAPFEPDPKPRDGYTGVIGRAFDQLGPGAFRFRPPTLGDTWDAGNLAKIDHIVVVMMENRSYDHVLGYRAQASPGDGTDGLTSEVIKAIQAADGGAHTVRKLRDAGFPPNVLGFKTRIPKGVGHDLDDVREQLSFRAPGPSNRQINSPKGFVSNFLKRLKSDPQGVVGDDVLGFYDAADLPIFAYLAGNYGYCDSYFCSHPGPTLPNRMYSLTGDVQYDRLGVPVLDNNNADNFLLSRAVTIYDLLTKRGIRWRVYESFPSVTMLRMFARYATNNTDVLPISRLEKDVANGDLLPFTAIEPAMHHHPEDDDHPDADMYRGQLFVKRVYDALTSNPSLWRKTLLIITYDEHGGLYDHVVPPVADLLEARGGVVVAGTQPGGVLTGDGSPADPAGALPGQGQSMPIRYGVRVPVFVVSPWTMRGKGPSIVLDHCSILKTVLARFAGTDKPFLNDRIHASQTFNAFLTEQQPRMDVPRSPKMAPLPIEVRVQAPGASAIVTPPLSRKRMREGPVDFHDLSGRLARMLGR